MHADDAVFAQALGARELDVVHGQDFAGGGARQADDQRALVEGERQRRQDQVQQAVGGEEGDRHAQKADRGAAARGRQARPPRDQVGQQHGEDHDQHQPDPEIGQRETQDRAGHDRLAARRVRPQPGIDAHRQTDQQRQDQGRHGQLHGRRHALEDQPHGGLAGQEAFAEVAVQRVAHESQILPPHRLVEAEGDAHGIALDLARIRADHHRHRIADHVDAGEDHRRHHDHDQRGLHQATDDIDQHGLLLPDRGPPGPLMIMMRAWRPAVRQKK